MKPLCDLFHQIAENVWDKIYKNHSRDNYLVEEGITRDQIVGSIQDYIEENSVRNILAQKTKNE